MCVTSTSRELTVTYHVPECPLETAQISTVSIVEAATVKVFVCGIVYSRRASDKLAVSGECAQAEEYVCMVPMKVEYVPARQTFMDRRAQPSVLPRTAFRHFPSPTRSVTPKEAVAARTMTLRITITCLADAPTVRRHGSVRPAASSVLVTITEAVIK